MSATQVHEPTETFRDRYLDLQHLIRELVLVRDHNRRFKEGEPQDEVLLFAEGALVVIVLERFVRAVLGDNAGPTETLHNLLQKAVAENLLRVPWDDQQDGIRRICSVRNTILHGNYEQAAKQAGCASVRDYFSQQFTPEVDKMFHIVDDMVKQIDPTTGRPHGAMGTSEHP